MEFIAKLLRTGLSPDDEGIKAIRVTLVNLIFLVGGPIMLLRLVLSLRAGMILHAMVFCMMAIILCTILYLNHSKRYRSARNLALPSMTLLIFYTLICYGLDGSTHMFLLILLIFVFVFFEKAVYQLIHVFTIFSAYIIPYIYLQNHEPLLIMAIPQSSFINVTLALVSATILSYLLNKTIFGYMQSSKIAIKELEEKNAFIAIQKEELELFASIASHDLKTPIRTINSFLGLVDKTNTVKDPKTKEYLHYAKSGAEQLSHLVNGISAFKRVDDFEINPNGYNIKSCIDRVILNLNPTNDPNIKIKHTHLPNIKIDENHLYHVIQNLVENALKYNESKVKEVNISGHHKQDTFNIEISDNGIGIDSKYSSYIFQPFKKLNSSLKYQSSGLGLSICQKIINLYKGEITVSKSPMGGSTFSIVLPLRLIIEK